jgi:hypothetical protein
MAKPKKLVCGFGINDADYPVQPKINGKQAACPIYTIWKGMLARCYSLNLPAYKGCSVCPEWISFMNFREWVISQDWKFMHLDKDLLVRGNRIYSQAACIFIPQALNKFIIEKPSSMGRWPTGVSWHKRERVFRANCSNPFTGKFEHLGCFDCPDAAHEAWRAKKHEHALKLAAQQTDPRIAKALSTRYLKEGDAAWTR